MEKYDHLSRDQLEVLADDLTKRSGHFEKLARKLDRTLTLPSGAMVRAGDVLVTKRGYAWLITAVGKHLAMGYIIEVNGKPYHQPFIDDEEQKLDIGGHVISTSEYDWRPWRGVYPDRPVPGEE